MEKCPFEAIEHGHQSSLMGKPLVLGAGASFIILVRQIIYGLINRIGFYGCRKCLFKSTCKYDIRHFKNMTVITT
jgi:hypothetical protein